MHRKNSKGTLKKSNALKLHFMRRLIFYGSFYRKEEKLLRQGNEGEKSYFEAKGYLVNCW